MVKSFLFLVLSVLFLHTWATGESVNDAARIARNLVDKSASSIGTMATTFPANHSTLPGEPFSLQEYYASCLSNGSLTLLFFPIAQHSKNILNSPNQAASISISSAVPDANRPRVSLIGNVTVFSPDNTPEMELIRDCYLEKHPDAKWWIPGGRAHMAFWARFDPHSIYFVGGFGGAHYIGYIPTDLYQRAGSVTEGLISQQTL